MPIEESIKEIFAKLDELEKRISALDGEPRRQQTNIKKLSIKEFLLSKKPEDAIQKTLVIGYYFEHFENMESFNIKDLADGFRQAKEPPPANINDKVNRNIGKKYIMEAKEEKGKFAAWVLTNSGENFVEELPKANEKR